jgi:hypothetical protein
LVAVLFAVGFIGAWAYLRAAYAETTYLGIAGLPPAGVLWAALFCTQIAAWVVVSGLSVKSVLSLPGRPAWATAAMGQAAAVVVVLGATCLLIFQTFIGRDAVGRYLAGLDPDPGLDRTIAGLGPVIAPTSYIPLLVVGWSLLVTHAVLGRLVIQAGDDVHTQVTRLRDLRDRLHMLLFGATVLVGLSSAAAVTLNRARGGPLAPEFFWIHGGLYSVLLVLLYVPAHVTLVRKGRIVAEHIPEGQDKVEAETGIQLSGVPGWDVVTSILVPVATSLLSIVK